MITIEYSSEIETLSHIDSPEEYIKETDANIYFTPDGLIRFENDPPIEKQYVGNISWTYVYAREMEADGVPCSYMCSHFDEDLSLLYYRLFDEDGIFRDSVSSIVSNILPSPVDFALISNFEIFPEFRGQDIGIKVLDLICRRIVNGAAVVAIQPMPVQFSELGKHYEYAQEMDLGNFIQDKKEAKRKLSNYYKRAGFCPLKKSEFLVRGQG